MTYLFPIIRIFCIFMEHKNALYSANIIKKDSIWQNKA